MKAYELRTPTKGSSKQRDARSISDDREEGRSSVDIGDDESIQDIAMDDDEDGNASDQQWKTVGRRKGKKRNRKRAAKQRDRVSEPQSMGGPSGATEKALKTWLKSKMRIRPDKVRDQRRKTSWTCRVWVQRPKVSAALFERR